MLKLFKPKRVYVDFAIGILGPTPTTEQPLQHKHLQMTRRPNDGSAVVVFLLFIAGIVWYVWSTTNSAASSTSSASSASLKPTQTEPSQPNTGSSDASSTPKLKLLNWTWGEADSDAFVEARGQVKNLTNDNIENVTAVVSFYDKKGHFIKSSETIVEYNPILPGQTSPFHVMETRNPAMSKATVEFKSLLGGTIETVK